MENYSKKSDSPKKGRIKSKAGYVIGSIALFAAACVAVPAAMAAVTGILYKASLDTAAVDDDDWGPVIEKKEKKGDE